MYSTEITINGKVYPIKFGSYVMKLIADDGINIQELGKRIQQNPYDIIPKIILFGAINASEKRKGVDFDLYDLYDWIDTLPGGLSSDEVLKITELFTSQISDGVPQEKEKQQKKPQAKKK